MSRKVRKKRTLPSRRKKKNKKSIAFQARPEAIIRTKAVRNFSQFWNQRKRWTSKSINYQDSEILGTAMLVFLVNLMLVASLIWGILSPSFILVPLILWGSKTLFELPLIVSGCRFYAIPEKLIWYFLAQVIYPFYVLSVAIAGVFGNFNWKNRSL